MQHQHIFSTIEYGEILVTGCNPAAVALPLVKLISERLPGFRVRFERSKNPTRGTLVVARRPIVTPGVLQETFVMAHAEWADGLQADQFIEALGNVADPSPSDIVVEPEFPSKTTPSPLLNKARRGYFPILEADEAEDGECSCEYSADIEPTLEEEVADAEIAVEDEFEAEKKAWMDRLSALVLDYVSRNHSLPPMHEIEEFLRGKFSIRDRGLSSVTVTGDLRVFLPDYNEIELRMAPLPRSLYILFLRHPEGIVLKSLPDYRAELEDIYSLVMPGRDDALALPMIAELTEPGSDSLRQKLSQIKKAVLRYVTNPALAEHYYVRGERGKAYGIDIDPDMVRLPKILHKVD